MTLFYNTVRCRRAIDVAAVAVAAAAVDAASAPDQRGDDDRDDDERADAQRHRESDDRRRVCFVAFDFRFCRFVFFDVD